MTRAAIQPMKSIELARAACDVTCFVCEAANTPRGRILPPAAVRRWPWPHQALGQRRAAADARRARAQRAGKTVYLGMLMDMLSRVSRGRLADPRPRRVPRSACSRRPFRPWPVASSRQRPARIRSGGTGCIARSSRPSPRPALPPSRSASLWGALTPSAKAGGCAIPRSSWSCPTWRARRSSKRSSTRRHSTSSARCCGIGRRDPAAGDAVELGGGKRDSDFRRDENPKLPE